MMFRQQLWPQGPNFYHRKKGLTFKCSVQNQLNSIWKVNFQFIFLSWFWVKFNFSNCIFKIKFQFIFSVVKVRTHLGPKLRFSKIWQFKKNLNEFIKIHESYFRRSSPGLQNSCYWMKKSCEPAHQQILLIDTKVSKTICSNNWKTLKNYLQNEFSHCVLNKR